MPVSEVTNISPILHEVGRRNPAGIMELGIGGGKYGVLCREVLDWVHGRVQPSTWEHRIVGIEGFPEYNNPAWGCYNEVYINDFRKTYHGVSGWPMVLMIDSLEHVEKDEAQALLAFLVAHNRHVIVSVPLGEHPQGAVFGNEFERHLSTWQEADFSLYDYRVLHKAVCLVVSIKGMING